MAADEVYGSKDGTPSGTSGPRRSRWRDCAELVSATLLVVIVSIAALLLGFKLPVAGFALFLIVVVAAIRLGFWYGTLTSVAAVACLDLFFTPPLYSLKTDAAGITALVAFESVVLVVSRLSTQAQTQAFIARQQGENMERLYELARNLLLINRNDAPGRQIAGYIRQATGAESVALFDAATLKVTATGAKDPDAAEAANRAWMMDRGVDSEAEQMWSRVLRIGHKATGAIAMRAAHLNPTVADAVASMAAIALARSHSLEKEARAEAARHSEQLRTAVLDALAHAFKTPLTAILAASSGLLEGGALSGPQRELVTLIDDQAAVLEDLTTRLLQTARLEGRKIHLRREEIGLGELIDEVIEPFAAQLRQRPARTVIQNRELPVRLDVHLITMALRQLLDNAIKYSDPGSEIAISAEEAGAPDHAEIVVSVRNQGPVIRPEDRERIFERFYRSPGTEHRAAGTGLGLSIAKKIAEAHLGRVWATSGEQGSTFFLALPLRLEGAELMTQRAGGTTAMPENSNV